MPSASGLRLIVQYFGKTKSPFSSFANIKTELCPSRAELVNVPTEYDYPLSLLDYILGLDRV